MTEQIILCWEGGKTHSSCKFPYYLPWKVKVLIAQLCPTLCNPMDCSLLGSSVHGILQGRILEWVAIHFPTGSYQTEGWSQVSWIAGIVLTAWGTKEVNSATYQSRCLPLPSIFPYLLCKGLVFKPTDIKPVRISRNVLKKETSIREIPSLMLTGMWGEEACVFDTCALWAWECPQNAGCFDALVWETEHNTLHLDKERKRIAVQEIASTVVKPDAHLGSIRDWTSSWKVGERAEDRDRCAHVYCSADLRTDRQGGRAG